MQDLKIRRAGEESAAALKAMLADDPIALEAQFGRINALEGARRADLLEQRMQFGARVRGIETGGHPDVAPARPLDRQSAAAGQSGACLREGVEESVRRRIINLAG